MATGLLNKGYVAHYGVTHTQRRASLITYTQLYQNCATQPFRPAAQACTSVHARRPSVVLEGPDPAPLYTF